MDLRRIGVFAGITAASATLYFAACDRDSGDESQTKPRTVHDIDLFELEGDAFDGADPGDDWSTIWANGGASIAHAFMVDPAPNSIFTGGRKDIQEIEDWAHKNGSVPDKDDITNAYAAAYDYDGELVIYFGADRLANDGDAQLGFWFFQQNIQPNPDGSFDGDHEIGDVLILVNFENGGSVPTIQVLEWVGSGGDQQGGTLQLLHDGTVVCGSDVDEPFCAITNPDPIPSPWPYTPKSGPSGSFPAQSFFEGGINIAQVFAAAGEAAPCFASFMAETRSSTSVTASLKDFALGSFPVCGIEIAKQCTAGDVNMDESGFVYTFEGTVTNTGFGTVHDVTVTDKGVVYDLGSIGPNESAPFGGTFESTLNPDTNSATATAALSPGGEAILSDDVGPVDCPPVDRDPAISVTKVCETGLAVVDGKVLVAISYSGQVCNDTSGADAIGLTNVTVTDDSGTPMDTSDDFVHSIGDLPADTCVPYGPGSFMPAEITNDNLDPLFAEFSDTVTAEGDANLGFGHVLETASDTCMLCE